MRIRLGVVDARPATLPGGAAQAAWPVLTACPAGSPSPGRMPPGPVALLELAVVGGPGAGRTFPLSRGEHVVGRAIDCGSGSTISVRPAHGVLSVSDSGVTLKDLETTNPSVVDGVPVPSAGVTLHIGARDRLGSTTLVLRRPSPRPATIGPGEGVVRFHRPPRFVQESTATSIEFPQEPTRPEGQRLPLLASIIPLALLALSACGSRTGRRAGPPIPSKGQRANITRTTKPVGVHTLEAGDKALSTFQVEVCRERRGGELTQSLESELLLCRAEREISGHGPSGRGDG